MDLGELLLVVNFRPFAGTKAHFLILPTRHIEDWSDLKENERIVLTLVVQSLAQSIRANCGVKETEIICYVQNGIQAGQTVPHSHMHVMTTPKYTPYLIDIQHQAVGMVTPALHSKEMTKLSDLFKPILFQALLFNAHPPKLLRFNAEEEVGKFKSLTMFDAYKKRSRKSNCMENREFSNDISGKLTQGGA